MTLDHLAEAVELLGELAGLADRRTVVVAGDVRLVLLAGVVRAVVPAEVGTAVPHVDVDRRAGREQPVQDVRRLLCAAGVVGLSPVVEPPVPELHADQGAGGLVSAQAGQGALRPGAERAGREQAGQPAAELEAVCCAVGGEEQAVDAAPDQAIAQVLQVGSVVPVAAVLVLDAHRDDRAALTGEQGHEYGYQSVEPRVDCRQVRAVGAAQPDGRVGQQPAGQSAELPLGADVGARPDDHVEVERARGPDEGGDVLRAGEVEPATDGLVDVPGDVRLDGVDAHRVQPGQPVLPELGADPEVVDGSRDDPVRPAVAQEAGVGEGEAGGWLEHGSPGDARRTDSGKRFPSGRYELAGPAVKAPGLICPDRRGRRPLR